VPCGTRAEGGRTARFHLSLTLQQNMAGAFRRIVCWQRVRLAILSFTAAATKAPITVCSDCCRAAFNFLDMQRTGLTSERQVSKTRQGAQFRSPYTHSFPLMGRRTPHCRDERNGASTAGTKTTAKRLHKARSDMRGTGIFLYFLRYSQRAARLSARTCVAQRLLLGYLYSISLAPLPSSIAMHSRLSLLL